MLTRLETLPARQRAYVVCGIWSTAVPLTSRFDRPLNLRMAHPSAPDAVGVRSSWTFVHQTCSSSLAQIRHEAKNRRWTRSSRRLRRRTASLSTPTSVGRNRCSDYRKCILEGHGVQVRWSEFLPCFSVPGQCGQAVSFSFCCQIRSGRPDYRRRLLERSHVRLLEWPICNTPVCPANVGNYYTFVFTIQYGPA